MIWSISYGHSHMIGSIGSSDSEPKMFRRNDSNRESNPDSAKRTDLNRATRTKTELALVRQQNGSLGTSRIVDA